MNKQRAAKLLDVNENASIEEIKKAYRKKASQYHPDKPGGDTEKFKEIQAAYEYFENPSKFRNSSTYSSDTKSSNGTWKEWAKWSEKFSKENPDYSQYFDSDWDFIRKNRPHTYNVTISLSQAFTGVNGLCQNIKMADGKIETHSFNIRPGVNTNEIIHTFVRNDEQYVFKAVINPIDSQNVKYTYESKSKLDSDVLTIYKGDITRDFYCPVVKLLLGGFIDVKTIDGSTVRVRIPEGQESGLKLKLKGKGFFVGDKQALRGDCYLKIIPEIKPLSKWSDDDLKSLVDAAQLETLSRKIKNNQ